jgi:predicted nucleic acid-binding protein
MIVISDTTPLISLLKINRIDLLEKLFGDVLIPQAVFEELTIDDRFRLETDQIRQKNYR